jgi:hypothetical protein
MTTLTAKMLQRLVGSLAVIAAVDISPWLL